MKTQRRHARHTLSATTIVLAWALLPACGTEDDPLDGNGTGIGPTTQGPVTGSDDSGGSSSGADPGGSSSGPTTDVTTGDPPDPTTGDSTDGSGGSTGSGGGSTGGDAPGIPNPTGSSGGSGGPVGRGEGTTSGGVKFYYNVPQCAVDGGPMPVVYAFHGTNQPTQHLVETLWANTPDQYCFAVFALASYDPIGWYFGPPDIPRFNELLEETHAKYDVDHARRYLEGGSAGGHLVHWLGPNNTETFSGIFAYAGAIVPAMQSNGWPPPDDARRIPVVIAHGMNDETVPYNFGTEARDAYEALGFPVKFIDMDGHCCDTSPFGPGYEFMYDNTLLGP